MDCALCASRIAGGVHCAKLNKTTNRVQNRIIAINLKILYPGPKTQVKEMNI